MLSENRCLKNQGWAESEQKYRRLPSVLQTHRMYTYTHCTICHTREHAYTHVPAATNKTKCKSTRKRKGHLIVKVYMPKTMLVNLWVKPTCIWYVLFTGQEVLKRRLFTEEHWITLTFYNKLYVIKNLLNPWPMTIHSIDLKIEFLLNFP